MGKIHKFVQKSLGSRALKSLVGKDTYDQIHPLGTQAETAYDAAKASEKALETAENEPVIPMPDEEELARIRRRRSARRGGGRSSTILSQDQGLGG